MPGWPTLPHDLPFECRRGHQSGGSKQIPSVIRNPRVPRGFQSPSRRRRWPLSGTIGRPKTHTGGQRLCYSVSRVGEYPTLGLDQICLRRMNKNCSPTIATPGPTPSARRISTGTSRTRKSLRPTTPSVRGGCGRARRVSPARGRCIPLAWQPNGAWQAICGILLDPAEGWIIVPSIQGGRRL